jgi:hypothetical protein
MIHRKSGLVQKHNHVRHNTSPKINTYKCLSMANTILYYTILYTLDWFECI